MGLTTILLFLSIGYGEKDQSAWSEHNQPWCEEQRRRERAWWFSRSIQQPIHGRDDDDANANGLLQRRTRKSLQVSGWTQEVLALLISAILLWAKAVCVT